MDEIEELISAKKILTMLKKCCYFRWNIVNVEEFFDCLCPQELTIDMKPMPLTPKVWVTVKHQYHENGASLLNHTIILHFKQTDYRYEDTINFKVVAYAWSNSAKKELFSFSKRRMIISEKTPFQLGMPAFDITTFCYEDEFNLVVRIEEFRVEQREIMRSGGADSNVNALQSLMSAMLLEGDGFEDVEFVIGEESVKAHKAIVSARCEVFKAMFNQDTLEKKTGIVTIEDTNMETFKSFLYYLYTNTIDIINDISFDLCKLADKYNIVGLKNICERYLGSNLTKDNAIEYLIKAQEYKFDLLKRAALIYIKSNMSSNANHFNHLDQLSEHPELYKEVIQPL